MHPRTVRRPFTVAPLAMALLLAAACDSNTIPTAPAASARPSFDIADASSDYKAGFYWLPPMVQQPAYAGAFDTELSPTVEICELAGESCGSIIATYTTTTGPGGEIVRHNADEQHYHVNWHTNEFDLSPTKFYRVTVSAGLNQTRLGYADVQPVSNGSGLKKVDTDEYIGLVDGRTLPIKFRIETGIVGGLRVEPTDAAAEPGDTREFTAIVSDLHGNVMTADVTWASSNDAVATVNETGLATAVDEGVVTITAAAQRISGSATLTVDRIVATVEVQPPDAEVEPGVTQEFTAILRDRHGVVISGEVSWSSSNDAVAIVDVAGLATAIADGIATITATSEGKSGSAILTVKRIVGSVEIQPMSAEAEPGATQQFVAIVRDRQGNIMTADITWASSNEAVATVTQTGLATAIDDGETSITATAQGVSGSATLTVDGGVVVVVVTSTGGGHACALSADGRAFCWGRNEMGQLGDGTLNNRTTPTPVAGGHTFIAIDADVFHTCAITELGEAYCWGLNQFGEVGDGTQTRRSTPVAVLGGHTFASISVGGQNTCAITPANKAYCWGAGFFGANGTGSQSNALSPQPVAGNHLFASVSAGSQYACGLTTDGQGFCWGNAGSGKLGNGMPGNRLAPVAISGGLTFASISAGVAHACAVTTSGTGYCWGGGNNGRLGNGATISHNTPQPVSGNLVFSSISAGGSHTCGVTVAGTGYCWGGGIEGSLGTASPFALLTPGLVVGGHSWRSIIAGVGATAGSGSSFASTCGVTINDQTYCWGSNFWGQIGDGTTIPRGSPRLVAPFP